jgi:hypothetical protein
MSIIPNDEPVYEDSLGHFPIVKQLGERILACESPYVLGVCGSWGSGKTSFLRKLWAYMGGPFEISLGLEFEGDADIETAERSQRQASLRSWFGDGYAEFAGRVGKRELIWFNPWQHQFETSPLDALLQEIRQHFNLKQKTFDGAGKLLDVTIHTTLNTLGEWGKAIKLPIPSAKTAMERGREYEAERFETKLTSQRFRDFFEKAVEVLTGGADGRLIIFIDDLDRCEGEVAYRLLESLKLFLNARNCTYIIGIDQKQLEEAIAKVLSGQDETWRYRPLARDYLSKMFQGLFLLPVPVSARQYLDGLLNREDKSFRQRLEVLFGWKDEDWDALIKALDESLPHNPRKIKAFISSWKLMLSLLPDPPPGAERLQWRLTVILNYLGQFEEPIFREVEEAPGFYSDQIVPFCQYGLSSHVLFEGLKVPYNASPAEAELKGGFGGTPPPATESALSPPEDAQGDKAKPAPPPRVFWISRLVNELRGDRGRSISEAEVRRHLLTTGG